MLQLIGLESSQSDIDRAKRSWTLGLGDGPTSNRAGVYIIISGIYREKTGCAFELLGNEARPKLRIGSEPTQNDAPAHRSQISDVQTFEAYTQVQRLLSQRSRLPHKQGAIDTGLEWIGARDFFKEKGLNMGGGSRGSFRVIVAYHSSAFLFLVQSVAD